MKNIIGKYVICKPSTSGYDEYFSSDGWCRDICMAVTYNSYDKAVPEFNKVRSKFRRKGSVQVKPVTDTMLFDSLQLSYYLGKSKGIAHRAVGGCLISQSAY